jgi:hypothetical protein
MHAVLKPDAVKTAAAEIRKARYLSCTVTDEELVEKVLLSYRENTQRRPPRRSRNA